jgi:hypothetical protein
MRWSRNLHHYRSVHLLVAFCARMLASARSLSENARRLRLPRFAEGAIDFVAQFDKLRIQPAQVNNLRH